MITTKQNIIACIFARGGSKGLPKKNIKEFAGKPLITWSIEMAKSISAIKRVIVSTDCEEIACVAKSCGAEVPFKRPKYLSSDSTNEFKVWKHTLNFLENEENKPIDMLLSLPATSPLRTKKDVKKCIDMFFKFQPDLVITASIAQRHPNFNIIKLDKKGFAHLFNDKHSSLHRRQDASNAFDIATVAYAVRPQYIKDASRLMDGNVRAVIIPKERSIDIDDLYDFEFAEYLFQKKLAKSLPKFPQ